MKPNMTCQHVTARERPLADGTEMDCLGASRTTSLRTSRLTLAGLRWRRRRRSGHVVGHVIGEMSIRRKDDGAHRAGEVGQVFAAGGQPAPSKLALVPLRTRLRTVGCGFGKRQMTSRQGRRHNLRTGDGMTMGRGRRQDFCRHQRRYISRNGQRTRTL